MNFRKARIEDLEKIITMYKNLIKHMYANKLEIWDDIYPCHFLEDDIISNKLYVLMDKDNIVSAFTLTRENAGQDYIEWQSCDDKVFYLEKLGVNPAYLNKGIASLMLDKAKEVSKQLGGKYLRLFVIDSNLPAINLYKKNKFKQAKGIYSQVIDDNLIFNEYGFEIEL